MTPRKPIFFAPICRKATTNRQHFWVPFVFWWALVGAFDFPWAPTDVQSAHLQYKSTLMVEHKMTKTPTKRKLWRTFSGDEPRAYFAQPNLIKPLLVMGAGRLYFAPFWLVWNLSCPAPKKALCGRFSTNGRKIFRLALGLCRQLFGGPDESEVNILNLKVRL